MNKREHSATLTQQQELEAATKVSCNWCGGNYYKGFQCRTCEPTEVVAVPEEQTESVPTGGPSSYYDMPFNTWITTNDMMEHLAEHKWGRYGIHLKDIFKGICRWGDKAGTTIV